MNSIQDLKSNGYHLHHNGNRMGYTRVADRGIPVPYKGRFGEGYIVPIGPMVKANGVNSSKYEIIQYWVK